MAVRPKLGSRGPTYSTFTWEFWWVWSIFDKYCEEWRDLCFRPSFTWLEGPGRHGRQRRRAP
jgi:hypothetical protein